MNGIPISDERDILSPTPEMIRAGVGALLVAFSEEYLSESTPGLEIAVCDVFQAMQIARHQPPLPTEPARLRELSLAELVAPNRAVSLRRVPQGHRLRDEVEP